MKEFNLKPSEVKKVIRKAKEELHCDCVIGAYTDSGSDLGWRDVFCEMDDADTFEYRGTVHLCVYECDRRRSYVTRVMGKEWQ